MGEDLRLSKLVPVINVYHKGQEAYMTYFNVLQHFFNSDRYQCGQPKSGVIITSHTNFLLT